MYKITTHPILPVPADDTITFYFNGKPVTGQKGFTVAAALHQSGFPVHSHSLQHRERSLECGIGKCGACEMLIDGEIKRICITKVDQVKEVSEIPLNYFPDATAPVKDTSIKVYQTQVAIIGAGPAGLAAREELNKHGIRNIVIDGNDKIGGQFLMQTHQFFFFEKEKKFGGMRGFDIANTLAGESLDGIMLNSVVWDIQEGKKIAVKNFTTEEIYYIESDFLIVATGAIPFMPAFENDDLPGVYTAAVVQKMMNQELTLLGKKILTVGAGNIGYLTSYQAMQAGAQVKAILEAMPREGGFPVQANRVRRLGIPIYLSHMLIKAIPNKDNTGITGAVVAECENFKPIPGTEKLIEDIDTINICTGLLPDDQLLTKGYEVYGRNCFGAGDAIRIGEGTSAVLKGKQCAYEILQQTKVRWNYDDYLSVSKEYIDSQQHPVRIIEKPFLPTAERMQEKPFVQIDCLYGFACNPCSFACKYGAITKASTSSVPNIDYNKCIGCMDCVYQCPGLAIFGYNIPKKQVFLPFEYETTEGKEVFLVDNQGKALGSGMIEKILKKPNKTNVARVSVADIDGEALLQVRGFMVKENMPQPLQWTKPDESVVSKTYICHCDDVEFQQVLDAIGDRTFITVEEIKHLTRIGMGPCRGKRCIPRLKNILRSKGIILEGDATPRGPMSNQIQMGEIYPKTKADEIILSFKPKSEKVACFIAGGGIAGSALFRYMAEAGLKPVMANDKRGSSWRNIAGGRPAFSLPEISDIAVHNLEIFKELQSISNIDFKPIRYVGFAHDDASYKALDASRAWSDAFMIDAKDFTKEISPYFNPNLKTYQAALITNDCWQATPGKTVETIRRIGLSKGGRIMENTQVVDVEKLNQGGYRILVRNHQEELLEFIADHFVNAMGAEAEFLAKKLDLELGLYPVKHQAFITRRLPLIGKNGAGLDMLIDRRNYKGFTAVYGQQLAETGQIIGCASPSIDPKETDKNLKINSREFLEIISEVFVDWIPELASVGFQAVWSGYYVEPRYIVDPEFGLMVGLRGHGFMLSQYLAKLYVDKLMGKEVPSYFDQLKKDREGLSEKAFK